MDKNELPETETDTLPDDAHAIKALGGNRLGGYAVLWGDAQTKDFDGEYFTPETEELTVIFKSMGGRLPFLYDHARDHALKTVPVGVVDVLEPDDIGLWYEAQLRRGDAYDKYISQLAQMTKTRKLRTSTGTFPQARRVEPDGRIARWPIAEISGTPTPADMRQVARPITEIKAAYKSLDLPTDQLDQLDDDATAEAEAARTTAPEVGAETADTGDAAQKALDLLALELDLLEMELIK